MADAMLVDDVVVEKGVIEQAEMVEQAWVVIVAVVLPKVLT